MIAEIVSRVEGIDLAVLLDIDREPCSVRLP